MRGLTPSYVPETGEVILDGLPAGPAGEAGLIPVAGLQLAFDRVDGHLVRALVDVAGESAMTLVSRLFGAAAADALRDLAARADGGRPHRMVPAGPCAALSSLARLDATRATSPVPASSPLWAMEAVVLAEKAGLRFRMLAEESRASCVLDAQLHRSLLPGMDVAAEVADLQKDCLAGPHWVLDPCLAPPELFRLGLTPHSDLKVHRDVGSDCLIVQATLAPTADRAAVGRWYARLVVPAARRVLASAGFKLVGSQALAELSFFLDRSEETWIEVVDDPERPVRSAKAHSIQRALRWADVALRAERAPHGIAPRSTEADWAALAAVAWERCRRDWEAAADPVRVAAVLAPRIPLPSPMYLAEIFGEGQGDA